MSNAIALHVHETEHPIHWDSARVIEREKHFACRKIKESLHIKRSVNCINTIQVTICILYGLPHCIVC